MQRIHVRHYQSGIAKMIGLRSDAEFRQAGVKTMRALQYFPTVEDPSTRRALFEVLQRILMGTDVVKNVNKNNASHAVLFEALALVSLCSTCQPLKKLNEVHLLDGMKFICKPKRGVAMLFTF